MADYVHPLPLGNRTLRPQRGLSVAARALLWLFGMIVVGLLVSTRLILRSVTSGTPTLAASLGIKFANVFQFYMERKMLLTLKQRAEAASASQ